MAVAVAVAVMAAIREGWVNVEIGGETWSLPNRLEREKV